jgi:hypothetical protein
MTKIRLEWEDLKQDTAGHIQRAAIPGGWLVRQVDDVCSDYTGNGTESGYEWRTSMAFVPDPDHVWGCPERQPVKPWKPFNPVVEMLKGAGVTLLIFVPIVTAYLVGYYTA